MLAQAARAVNGEHDVFLKLSQLCLRAVNVPLTCFLSLELVVSPRLSGDVKFCKSDDLGKRHATGVALVACRLH